MITSLARIQQVNQWSHANWMRKKSRINKIHNVMIGVAYNFIGTCTDEDYPSWSNRVVRIIDIIYKKWNVVCFLFVCVRSWWHGIVPVYKITTSTGPHCRTRSEYESESSDNHFSKSELIEDWRLMGQFVASWWCLLAIIYIILTLYSIPCL